MNSGRTIFTQVMDFLPLPEFHRCVERYRGDYKVQSFSCGDQFLCLAFAQLTGRESLRDFEACLRSQQPKLYHMGFRGRISRNTLAHANETREWRPVLRSTGLRSDQTIQLTGPKTSRLYPDPLRRIHYFDAEKELRLIFLTNNFLLPAFTIAELYRARWQVELFSRWIKQHLHFKSFFGTSENAVKTQVWVAIAVYVLVAIVKKRAELELSLYKILQVLSVTIFEKIPLLQGFSYFDIDAPECVPDIQLELFNL